MGEVACTGAKRSGIEENITIRVGQVTAVERCSEFVKVDLVAQLEKVVGLNRVVDVEVFL
jgi:hypothetical protein